MSFKLLIFGDLHIRETNPVNRIDDFRSEQERKLKYVMRVANKRYKYISIILQPGDFFDAADKVSYNMLSKWIDFFAPFPPILTVLGQHDTKNHHIHNTNIPTSVLQSSKVLKVLGNIPFDPYEKLHIYGASWGQEIPEIQNKDVFNVLIIHKMIVKDKALWNEQEDYVLANKFLKSNGFDLIVSGDNHQKFVYAYDNRTLINAGSLMRTSINQNKHEPAAFVFDPITREINEIKIPVKPFGEVFNMVKHKEQETTKEELRSLVESLKQDYLPMSDFLKNLEILKRKSDKDVIEFFEEMEKDESDTFRSKKMGI